jgi:hypothetical protein
MNDALDARVIVSNYKYTIVVPFDDYTYRGLNLVDFCLYDYCSMVYMRQRKGGIGFTTQHSQKKSHYQFIHQDSYAIPNLLGRLPFVSKSTRNMGKQEEYCCLISWLFIPWSHHHPHMATNQSWKEFYNANMERISPRLLHHINNLDFLHKSKEETQIDILQQKARSNERVMNDWEGNRMPDGSDDGEVDNVIDNHDEMTANINTIIKEIISSPSMGENDRYVHGATDANLDAG